MSCPPAAKSCSVSSMAFPLENVRRARLTGGTVVFTTHLPRRPMLRLQGPVPDWQVLSEDSLLPSIRAGLEQVKVGLAESIGEVKQGSLSRGHGNFPTAVASTTAPLSHLSPESAEGALLREKGAAWKAVHLLGLCWNSSSSHSFPNTLPTAPSLIRNCS